MTTPFWIASGVSDWGIATGTPPRSFSTSALVPATRSSMPLRSFSDCTGVLVIRLVGGQVKSARIFTFSNSLGWCFCTRSSSTWLATRALVKPW